MIAFSLTITFSAITAPDKILADYFIVEPERIIVLISSQLSSIVTFESIIQFYNITFFPITQSEPMQVFLMIQPPSILQLEAIATLASNYVDNGILTVFSTYVFYIWTR
jgi:hypothetical protein